MDKGRTTTLSGDLTTCIHCGQNVSAAAKHEDRQLISAKLLASELPQEYQFQQVPQVRPIEQLRSRLLKAGWSVEETDLFIVELQRTYRGLDNG